MLDRGEPFPLFEVPTWTVAPRRSSAYRSVTIARSRSILRRTSRRARRCRSRTGARDATLRNITRPCHLNSSQHCRSRRSQQRKALTCFVWTSGPFLAQALRLIELWGFRYSTRAFTWVKLKRARATQLPLPLSEEDLHVGLGLTVRHQTEIVLLARRGSAGATPRTCAR